MKKLFLVANWKSNKTVGEAESWIEEIKNLKVEGRNSEVVLCPPFTLLYPLKKLIADYKLPITLGAQDVSPFPDGAYTGEVSARMLRDLEVKFVIIGHSERRKYFKEDDQTLTNKVKETLDAGLTPIFCVQDKTTPVPDGVKIIAYEPIFAIGTGTAETPEKSNETAGDFKELIGKDLIVLYGGSVTHENAGDFCRQQNINGVLVGGASLDPVKFSQIIYHAAQI